MKILLGVDRFLLGSGISRVVDELSKYLYHKGYDVKIICGKCNVETDVPLIFCKYNEALGQCSIRDVIAKVKIERPEIFHSHYYPMDLCGSLINSDGIKHVMHSHGVNHQSWHLSWKNPPALIRADVGEFMGSHFSRKVICVSNYMAKTLELKYRLNNCKIEVVYNGVNLLKFNPSIDGSEIRGRLGLVNNDTLLLYVATFSPRKRHDLLIDCMDLLTKTDKSIKLLLVGETGKTTAKHKNALAKRIKDIDLEDNIFLYGSITEEELPKFYAACDIFVSTSSWESFGLPIIEAMACGKPVIGFNRTAVSELIIDNYNGYIVNYPDIHMMSSKITNLINDKQRRILFGKNGRELVETSFDSLKNIKKLEEVYLTLI